MTQSRQAFSLLEVTVGTAMLSLLGILAFTVFAWCSSTFALSNTRLELQGEIRRINTAMRRDILGSCFTSLSSNYVNVTISKNPPDPISLDPIVVPRDGISFSSISNMTNYADSYDHDTGLCKFDCWTVYCAWTNPDDIYDCRLYRYRVEAHAGNISQLPLDGFTKPTSAATSYMWPGPGATPYHYIGDLHNYSNRIRSFQILPNLGDQTLEVKISLLGPLGQLKTSQRKTSEVVESSILLKAENTWPKL